MARILTLYLCLLFSAVAAQPSPAPPQSLPTKVERWEYAELSTANFGPDDRYSWNSGSVRIEAKQIGELARKMATAGIVARAVQGSYELFNELGERGWELVAISTGREVGTYYHFKRRKA